MISGPERVRMVVMQPEVFSIRLLPPDISDTSGERLGEISVGSFTERFTVYPLGASVKAVALGWRDELRLLLSNAPSIGLPTTFNMAWVLYRFGSEVLVHQMLMLPGVG